MRMNFNGAAAANPVMTLPLEEKQERVKAGRRRVAYRARAALGKSEWLENAAWALLAFIAVGALVLSFAF